MSLSLVWFVRLCIWGDEDVSCLFPNTLFVFEEHFAGDAPSLGPLSAISHCFSCMNADRKCQSAAYTPLIKTQTHLFPHCTVSQSLCSPLSENAELCKKKSAVQHNVWQKVRGCCSCCIVEDFYLKIRQSCHHFFLPQVLEFTEKGRKCGLASQLGYKTITLSSGCCYSWTAACLSRSV